MNSHAQKASSAIESMAVSTAKAAALQRAVAVIQKKFGAGSIALLGSATLSRNASGLGLKN